MSRRRLDLHGRSKEGTAEHGTHPHTHSIRFSLFMYGQDTDFVRSFVEPVTLISDLYRTAVTI
jgi:hypothetical protein